MKESLRHHGQYRPIVVNRRTREVGLGKAERIQGREDLAQLHRRPLHLAELLDECAGDRDDPLLVRLIGSFLPPTEVADACPGPAEALACDESAY